MDPYFPPSSYNQVPSTSTRGPTKSQTTGRKNAQWGPHENMIFVSACESVIADGHRNGRCFTKHRWDTLVHLFNSTSGHNWNKQQLKNHWDALRFKHRRFEELINSSGVEYNSATGRIVASDEWWVQKIKENKDYKEFQDKDCSDVYGYKVLFGDAFDSEKYAITPTKLCRTGFSIFEDSGFDDLRDAVPVELESSGSSDEAEKSEKHLSTMNVSGARSGEKRKSGSRLHTDKRKKLSAWYVSYSVNRTTSANENVVAKIEKLVGPNVADVKTCMKELLSTGRLHKKTDIYFWTCSFLSLKRNREILEMQDDASEKMDWVEWSWQEYRKAQPK